MQAVCLNSSGIQYIKNHQPAKSHTQYVSVRVLTAGICETDLQLKQGYMGFTGVLGHEFVGIAESGKFEGQRVVGEINCACNKCEFCQRGLKRHCSGRSVIGILNHDGAFAETVWVPEENLFAVPDHVSTDQAVFTEPVAAACRILEQVTIDAASKVVIFGDGRLGNLCAQVLKSTGCQLLVVGKHDWKLRRLSQLGVSTVLLADFAHKADRDIVVDCTGSTLGFESALKTVRPNGTIVLKTTVAAQQSLHLAPVVIDEVNVIGSRCGPFGPALKMIADGTVQVEDLISARYPLQDALKAFTHAEQPDTLKVLFDISKER